MTYIRWPVAPPTRSQVGDLMEFTALEYLSINFTSLILTTDSTQMGEILPQSLRVLELHEAPLRRTLEELEGLAGDHEESRF
jgi:hypothetical protein